MAIAPVRLNHAVLFVADLDRAVRFYTDVFGMGVVAREPRANATFLRLPRSGNHHDLGLFGVGTFGGPKRRGAIGLYHLAWQLDTIDELAQARETLLATARTPASRATAPPRASTAPTPTATSSSSCGGFPATSGARTRTRRPSTTSTSPMRNAAGLVSRPPVRLSSNRWSRSHERLRRTRGRLAPPDDPAAPLVVLLHGRGSNEPTSSGSPSTFPAARPTRRCGRRSPRAAGTPGSRTAAPAVPSPNRSPRRSRGSGLGSTPPRSGRPVVLVGFSDGAAVAGGLALDDPSRFAGAAVLYGTLPFDTVVPTTMGRLSPLDVFVAHGNAVDRTWQYLHTTPVPMSPVPAGRGRCEPRPRGPPPEARVLNTRDVGDRSSRAGARSIMRVPINGSSRRRSQGRPPDFGTSRSIIMTPRRPDTIGPGSAGSAYLAIPAGARGELRDP
jgi:catechol 2,3-dioxygenase-like lactoylglutathione lyase family enzyme